MRVTSHEEFFVSIGRGYTRPLFTAFSIFRRFNFMRFRSADLSRARTKLDIILRRQRWFNSTVSLSALLLLTNTVAIKSPPHTGTRIIVIPVGKRELTRRAAATRLLLDKEGIVACTIIRFCAFKPFHLDVLPSRESAFRRCAFIKRAGSSRDIVAHCRLFVLPRRRNSLQITLPK